MACGAGTCYSYCGTDKGTDNCTAGCRSDGSSSDYGGCTGNGCTKYCAEGCYQDCGSSCNQNCAPGCGGDCSAYCANSCNGACTAACKESCDSTCNYACINQTQTTNINKLILNKKLKAEDIQRISDAIKFEVVDRRDGTLTYDINISKAEKLNYSKMNQIESNLVQLEQKPVYSAKIKNKAILLLAEDLIKKIKNAYNEIVPLK